LFTRERPSSLGKKKGRMDKFLLPSQLQFVMILAGSIGCSDTAGDSLRSLKFTINDGRREFRRRGLGFGFLSSEIVISGEVFVGDDSTGNVFNRGRARKSPNFSRSTSTMVAIGSLTMKEESVRERLAQEPLQRSTFSYRIGSERILEY
jgi:hypothetical protein